MRSTRACLAVKGCAPSQKEEEEEEKEGRKGGGGRGHAGCRSTSQSDLLSVSSPAARHPLPFARRGWVSFPLRGRCGPRDVVPSHCRPAFFICIQSPKTSAQRHRTIVLSPSSFSSSLLPPSLDHAGVKLAPAPAASSSHLAVPGGDVSIGTSLMRLLVEIIGGEGGEIRGGGGILRWAQRPPSFRLK